MQRLYLQFYLTILAVLAVFVGGAVLTWKLTEDQTPQYFEVAAELTGALLPDSDAPPSESQKVVDALNRKLRFDIALYRADGTLIASAGRPQPRLEVRALAVGVETATAGPLVPYDAVDFAVPDVRPRLQAVAELRQRLVGRASSDVQPVRADVLAGAGPARSAQTRLCPQRQAVAWD